MSKPRILLVEDSESVSDLYSTYLESEGWRVTPARDGAEVRERLAAFFPEVVVLDMHLPDIWGMPLLDLVRELAPDSGIVVATAHGSVDLAVSAIQHGAMDFLEKPVNRTRLVQTVGSALERVNLRERLDRMLRDYGRESYYGFVGSSVSMQGVYRTIEAAATSKATVFITGESGTGKEVCAEAVHRAGRRGQGPFVALNCAAIPKDLIESEIFGHMKGAFTGAHQTREGAAERADGGTLFLDEICEMQLELQSKLLRFLQTGTVQRVGADETRPVDVRIVCATNRDPWEEVLEGRFREDLYYRLHVIPIHLPPLRDRDGDALLLAGHFLNHFAEEEEKRFNGFDDDAIAVIDEYPWPGNVRELQNVIRNVVVLNPGGSVAASMLPSMLDREEKKSRHESVGRRAAPDSATKDDDGGEILPLEVMERRYIEKAVARCQGNITKAARKLSVNPSTIYRKMQRWAGGDED